ncbi:MAG: DUF1614 domain-containing protein [Candidatus Nealsonbacteria bacterium]
MFFLPISILILILFIFFFPVLFVLGYFNIITIGFEKLGFSSEATFLIFFLILIGSLINVPLTRMKLTYIEEKSFFGLLKTTKLKPSGLAINLGGAVIPILLSIYFLIFIPLDLILIPLILMIISLKFLARVVPGRGIVIPALLPPLLALLFAFIFVPNFKAPSAFVIGVLGTLIGGDILNLSKAMKSNSGLISIGGAGVFDGIFLVGIVSALFT